MKEKILLYISLICSIVGLIILYYISQVIEPPQTDINKITVDDMGKNVKVCGTVASKSISKTQHVFLELKDNSANIDVVIFNNSAEVFGAYDIKKGDEICVVGQVDEYNNKLEIIPKEKIELVS